MTIDEIAQKCATVHQLIRSHTLITPLLKSHALSQLIDGEVYLKMESEQHTGSFKARGSLSKVLKLQAQKRELPLYTASTGNHGLGFARAVSLSKTTGTIFLPKKASRAKIKKLEYYPVQLEFHPGTSLETELHAKQKAKEDGAIWVSPYNDMDVIYGQGTIGVELMDQCPVFDEVLITVGGGGLISGIGAFLKSKMPEVKIVSCQPKNSCEMTKSLEAGRIVNMEEDLPTWSDGSAGGIEPGAVTFDICKEIIDRSILVSEEQIKNALHFMLTEHGKIIEGAAGVALASLIENKTSFIGKKIVIIICGGNIEFSKLRELICK